MIGATISHYKITEKLGEGGMGVVYKAEDTKLERAVALKFLAGHLLNDDEAKARFLREAKAAAGLHHPNICPVHEIGEAEGRTFLSMAFLEGESLEARIERGPLALKEALDIGHQVAEGLEAAHEKGVVHRDIKPGNVMVDAKSRATIMDFGLARLTEASRLTKADQTMGTVAYMSPEQAQGMEVDHRSDVWALGCVLYEMVSGQRPFQGQYDQALLYEIVHEEPAALTGLRTGVPVELELLTAKCLEKDCEDRYGSTQEVARDLRKLAEKLRSGRSTILRTVQMTGAIPATTSVAHTVNPAAALSPNVVTVNRSSQQVLQGLAAVLGVALLTLAFVHFTQAPPEAPPATVTRFSFAPAGLTQVQISPDGKYVLYAATTDDGSSLWLRSLSDESARELPGTEGAIDGFWSPESSEIGFVVGTAKKELKRVSIDGGSSITLCELPVQIDFFGGTWSPDGERIVFSSGLQLYEIAARGGRPQLLFDASDGPRPVSLYPHFLPTGAGPPALVYSAARAPSDRRVAVLNLETGERRELGPGTAPVYSRDGYLIHAPANSNGRGLSALPFSLDTLETTGDAFPISTAGFAATVSHDGTLVYVDQAGNHNVQTLVWRSRSGETIKTVGRPQPIAQPALSSDGQRVAVRSAESGNLDIWVYDLTRSTTTRLTFEDEFESDPAWSPSGEEIVYGIIGKPGRIVRRTADGTGEPVVVVETSDWVSSPDWSRDGRYIVFHGFNTETRGTDILYVELGADGDAREPVPFLSSPADEQFPKLSPDGRLVAYTSNESGRYEIYVRPFPSGDGKWQASVNGGEGPRWSRDGTELYYVEGNALMAVPVSTESAFALGRPQPLFKAAGLAASGRPQPLFKAAGLAASISITPGGYDVSADGQRFLTVLPVESSEAAPATIRMVENWHQEFRDREQD